MAKKTTKAATKAKNNTSGAPEQENDPSALDTIDHDMEDSDEQNESDDAESEDENDSDDEEDDLDDTEQEQETSTRPTQRGLPPPLPTSQSIRVMPGAGAVDAGITYEQRKHHVKAALDKQPKVAMLIPKTEGEDPSLAYETVQINGYRMTIKKGCMVTLPEQVAQILSEKYNIEMTAGSESLVGTSTDREKALS